MPPLFALAGERRLELPSAHPSTCFRAPTRVVQNFPLHRRDCQLGVVLLFCAKAASALFFFPLEGDAVLLRDQYGALLSNPLSLTYLRRDYRISALNKGTPRPRFFSVFFFVSLLTDYNFGRCFISFLVETFGPLLCSRLSRSFGSAFTLSSLESVRVAFDPRAKRLEPFPRSQGSCRRFP